MSFVGGPGRQLTRRPASSDGSLISLREEALSEVKQPQCSHKSRTCRALNELAPSHRILGQGLIGPLSRLNNAAHNEPHALTIARPYLSQQRPVDQARQFSFGRWLRLPQFPPRVDRTAFGISSVHQAVRRHRGLDHGQDPLGLTNPATRSVLDWPSPRGRDFMAALERVSRQPSA
jgi:hypothetical protein